MAKQKTLRTSTQEVVADLRQRVMNMVISKKMTQKAAAETFGVGYSTVKKWYKSYRLEGKKGLAMKKRGRAKGSKQITKEQEKAIKKKIVDKVPEQLKLPFALWTREAVQGLIKREFGIEKSISQVGRYLKEWGFTPQKPVYRAYEQQPEAVKRWLEVEYPQIKKEAAEQGAEIFWEDEMGMRSDHQAGTSYAPKGKTPVIKKTGQRFRLNMISAISNQGKKQFMLFRDGFNSKKFLIFLKQLVKNKRKKIYLIVDSHPAHRSEGVKNWLKENEKKIKLIYLPYYSPELNPQEYMNNDIKTNAVGKHRTLNVNALEKHVKAYIETRDAQIVKNYFQHPHIKYAA